MLPGDDASERFVMATQPEGYEAELNAELEELEKQEFAVFTALLSPETEGHDVAELAAYLRRYASLRLATGDVEAARALVDNADAAGLPLPELKEAVLAFEREDLVTLSNFESGALGAATRRLAQRLATKLAKSYREITVSHAHSLGVNPQVQGWPIVNGFVKVPAPEEEPVDNDTEILLQASQILNRL